MKNLFIIPIIILISTLLWADDKDLFIGKWYTKGNKSIIEVVKSGTTYYGKIVWLKEPNKDDGSPKLDSKNKKKSLQSRPILGLKLLKGFKRKGNENFWDDGEIYNPEDGKTYSCEISLNDNGTLKVRGYIGISLIGKTQIWRRAK